MVRRSPDASFMGDTYVFPGGTVDDIDHSASAAAAVSMARSLDSSGLSWRAAALRELAEEVGVWLTDRPVDRDAAAGWLDGDVFAAALDAGIRFRGDALFYLANWVSPSHLSSRFDARFYAAVVPAATDATADDVEGHDATWVTPPGALARAERGAWDVPLPTRKTLELLGRFASPDQVLAYAAALPGVESIEPRLRRDAKGNRTVVLPRQSAGHPDLQG